MLHHIIPFPCWAASESIPQRSFFFGFRKHLLESCPNIYWIATEVQLLHSVGMTVSCRHTLCWVLLCAWWSWLSRITGCRGLLEGNVGTPQSYILSGPWVVSQRTLSLSLRLSGWSTWAGTTDWRIDLGSFPSLSSLCGSSQNFPPCSAGRYRLLLLCVQASEKASCSLEQISLLLVHCWRNLKPK